jgi:hypothetical protein
MSCCSLTRPRSCPVCAIRRRIDSIWFDLEGDTSAIRDTVEIHDRLDKSPLLLRKCEASTYDAHELQVRGLRRGVHVSLVPLLASFQLPRRCLQFDYYYPFQIAAAGLDVRHESQRVQHQP